MASSMASTPANSSTPPTTVLNLSSSLTFPNSPNSIPRLGFGVYKLRGDACLAACLAALSAGYRHIDSARLYRNEEHVRGALAQSGLARDKVFLTTKVGAPGPRKRKPQSTSNGTVVGVEHDACLSASQSIDRIAGEGGYVDLLLVHVPGPDYEYRKATWAALERLRVEGRARSIGVSNYHVAHLEEMREYATTWPPSVNQIELHPWCQQRQLVDYCRAHSIVVQAYSPLATGARLSHPLVGQIASKRENSAAQVLIRYALQKGWVPLPKSGQELRIQENADVFGFELDEHDMAALDGLDEGPAGACFPVNCSQ